MKSDRVLVIAEAANPEWVSVPLVGWSLAQALRSVADVHLVTQVRNREAILRAGLIEGVDFTAIDSEAIARPLHRIAGVLSMGKGKGWTMRTAMSALSYPYFEHLVWRRFGADIQAGRFDIVHRITPLSPTVNSPIARRCQKAGVPFVLGPLNGGVPWPRGFESERIREREFLSYLRGLNRYRPGRYATLAAAKAIIAGSRHVEQEIPLRFQGKTHYLPENAVDPERFELETPLSPPPQVAPRLRACFIGRMVPYKGPDMLLEAAAPLLRDGRMSLEMIGDGPMMSDLRSLAQSLSLGDTALRFHGWQEHRQIARLARDCNLLTFPSIREFGGGVVLEAMAMGLVPMIVDYAGPAELVTPDCGIKIPLGTRSEIVSGFRNALERLADDPGSLEPMRAAGRQLVREKYTWARKAEQVAAIWQHVREATRAP